MQAADPMPEGGRDFPGLKIVSAKRRRGSKLSARDRDDAVAYRATCLEDCREKHAAGDGEEWAHRAELLASVGSVGWWQANRRGCYTVDTDRALYCAGTYRGGAFWDEMKAKYGDKS